MTRKPTSTKNSKPAQISEHDLMRMESSIQNGQMTLEEAVKLFGFQIGKGDKGKKELPSFALPLNDDGALTLQSGAVYGTYVDLEGTAKNEVELITRYMEASLQPECESAIDDVVNEAIVAEELDVALQLDLDNLEGYTDNFKEILKEEFQSILDLLNFGDEGHEIFRRWYVNGRLFYHINIDKDNPKEGIKELRYIDPRRIRKIREVKKKMDSEGREVIEREDEYFIYNERGINNTQTSSVMGIRIAPDAICYVHSGLVEQGRSSMVLSWLHKALKPLNQLRHMEDAVVIYRLSRAPERRIFYIDVGNLPKIKAEQYLKDVMNRYRNKLVYDSTTGEVRDDKRHLSMMEDYWLPRREGKTSTQIDTLKGAENLGEMTDVTYFEEKLYRALGVPISRLKSEGGFNLGRSAEISRDEVKFYKFVVRLRKRFTHLFDRLMSTQLMLKGICDHESWIDIRRGIKYKFAEEFNYAELKDFEMRRERYGMLMEISPYVGVYISRKRVMREILKYTDDDIKQIDAEIDEEKAFLPAMLATQQMAAQMVGDTQQGIMQQTRFNNQQGFGEK